MASSFKPVTGDTSAGGGAGGGAGASSGSAAASASSMSAEDVAASIGLSPALLPALDEGWQELAVAADKPFASDADFLATARKLLQLRSQVC